MISLLKNKKYLTVFNLTLCAVIFFVDTKFPATVAASVPYVGVIMLSLWLPKPIHALYFAILCTVLTILGLFYSASSSNFHIIEVILDRLAALFAIWITAILAMYRKTSAIQLRQAEMRQRAILYASIDPILITNEIGSIESASSSIQHLFDFTPEELIGNNLQILFKETIDFTKDRNNQEVQGKKKDGQLLDCEISISKVHLPELKETLNTVIIRDISERKKSQDKLLWLSTHDELTKIYNRRYLNKQLDTEWRRLSRQNLPLALIMIDVDYFKNYNDTLGHQSGDQCLQKVASVLSKHLRRSGDFSARYGGEEFAILLPNTDLEGASAIAKLIQQDVYDLDISHPVSDVGGRISISMGISAMIPTKACTSEVLIRQADFALYQAKEKGRNNFQLYMD